jgi:hypothetical protein
VVTLAESFVAGSLPQGAGDLGNVSRDRYPINEDPSNCPLCQEIADVAEKLS